ncbi:MAG TPA: TetR/AcrR family transcriptional regulator [Lachnospiraceae bacterium]|nr:TetR/AcrR family transcriptional regulator [Lachnospiraceae bacterium]
MKQLSPYHHGNLEQQLITVGIHMVQEDGIKNLSLRKLAKACGVSEAAPYSHFKNKDELLIAMQNFVTEKLMSCMKTALCEPEDNQTGRTLLSIGKAYVMFFIDHPAYFTFLFSQPCITIDLSSNMNPTDYPPFHFFKETTYRIYRKKGLPDERIKYGIVAMWAKVHGIASIASLDTVSTDFIWEDVLEQILVE